MDNTTLTATVAAMTEEETTEWYFFRSYVGAALWSSCDDAGNPMDGFAHADGEGIDPATYEAMRRECAMFYAANVAAIHCDDAPLSVEFEGSIASREAAMAGHDFWLTRCGHGAGFWDGDWPEPYATTLDNVSNAFGNVDLYVGDDGLIYAC